MSSIPGQGTKIPRAPQCDQKANERKHQKQDSCPILPTIAHWYVTYYILKLFCLLYLFMVYSLYSNIFEVDSMDFLHIQMKALSFMQVIGKW